MISVTSKSPYALKALAELARSGGKETPVPIGDLARRRDIPVQFLEQLFEALRRGGVLARRWGLPKAVASVIERHHADDAVAEAAFVRLADMLAHYAQGSQVSPTELLKTARSIGLGPAELRTVMYDLPYPTTGQRRQIDPCPLSGRELEVLKRLAEGKVYKQIALELKLSTSTVRTHLHNIYGKLGAVDRAQAVLIATERGWL